MMVRVKTSAKPAPEHAAQLRGPQQNGIVVDFAGFDDVLRQRIVGIVLKDEREPT